jgi:3-oxoacyl-[acyl-carrier protein] reductase
MSEPTPSDPLVALVTGGSRGIGRAICRSLAARGVHVVINYRQDDDAAAALAAELHAAGHHASCSRADVADPEAVRAMFAQIRAQQGRLDLLINSAGILHEGLFLFTPLDRFWQVMQVNLGGVVHCCRAAIPMLGRHKRGRIINLASIAALHQSAGLAAYAASKAGVLALTGVLARELAAAGIRVNAVAPGLVETDMVAAMADPSARERAVQGQPVRRLGRPEEVANLVTYLALDAPDYLTGETLRLDGGALIGA